MTQPLHIGLLGAMPEEIGPCCHQAEVCNSLTHLERVVANLLRVTS